MYREMFLKEVRQSYKSMCISIPTVRQSILLNIIQIHQITPTGDPLVNNDSAAQSYHTMKQLPDESTNTYPIRIEGKVRILLRLGFDVPSLQQQAMRFLLSLDSVKHADMIADLKNDALKKSRYYLPC